MQLEQSLALALSDPREGLLELDRLDCEDDLGHFLRSGWRYIDPAPYVHGWHLDAIAEHLQAVTDGHIRRLIINVPPRHSKSSVVSVAWPAWTWAQRVRGPLSGPEVQFLSASYAQALSTRDAMKSRRLIQSPWYQERWGDRFALTSDQNAKMRYDNDRGGYRIATSVDGGLTGEGGSIILVDDPLNAKEAVSEATRLAMIEWWDGAMSTRLNDPKTGAYVVIMQRLHEEDLTGHILASNHGDWEHLCLPARYDSSRHCVTSIGWSDPRTRDGEILSPDRFGEKELSLLERSLGTYGAAGQLQQAPAPKGGGIIKRDMWQLWGNPADPDDPQFRAFPAFDLIVGSLDPAYTEKQQNDPCAMTLWGVYKDKHDVPRVMLITAWRERLDFHPLVEKTHATCKRFKVDRLLIEAKASGISVGQEMRRLYSNYGYSVELIDPKKQDKVARAYAVQPVFENGTVFAPDRSWADMVITECEQFPRGKHDDLCLVGETLITMADGSRLPLSEVIPGMLVATPDGPRSVLAAAQTGVKEVYRLEFEGGSLTGTKDHPIWVNGRWKPLASVKQGDMLATPYPSEARECPSSQKALLSKLLYSTVVATGGILTRATRLIAATIHGLAHACTATYGRPRTGQYLPGGRSTTGTAIHLIIGWITSNASPPTSTVSFMPRQDASVRGLRSTWLTLIAFDPRRWLGIAARKGALGTGKTLSVQSISSACRAPTVKADTKGDASGAGMTSWLNRLARRFAALRAKRPNRGSCLVRAVVATRTMQPVYNLTVEGAHCYYANGVLTHNCDTVTQGLRWLRDRGFLTRTDEHQAMLNEMASHRGAGPKPLYPGMRQAAR